MTLRRRSLFAALLGWTLFVTSSHAASLSSTKGTVEIKKSGAALWTQAKTKDGVKAGDVLRTGAGSSAELSTAEGHKLQMREKTTARVDSTDNGESRFFLEVGRLRSKVAKLRRLQKFEIRTPLAVASVRGTVFDVEVAEDKTSKLFVSEGAVAYKELAGVAPEVLVPAGQDYTFNPPSGDKSNNSGTGDKDKTDKGNKERSLNREKELSEKEQKEQKEKEGEKSKDLEKSDKEKEKALRYAEKEQKEKEKEAGLKETESEKEKNPKALASRDLKSDLLRDELKREILRETEMSLEKDFSQSDVVQDLKQEQAEDGRVMIDRLGRRVRFEEYLTRGKDNRSFSQRYLTRRENRTDEARYTVYARNELPKDLREANLFIGKHGDLDKNWATGREYFTTNNEGMYYRTWGSDGEPRNFDDGLARVVFGHIFEETSGFKGEPVLLSHLIPDSNYANGVSLATHGRDRDDVFGVSGQSAGDGGQDILTGYVDYQADSSFGGIGNKEDRPIDEYGLEKRMAYFESEGIRDLYQQSEGFTRDTVAVFDGKEMSLQKSEEDNRTLLAKARAVSLERSLLSTYFTPEGDKAAVVRIDTYYVADEKGEVLPYGKIGDSLFGSEGIHREEVYSTTFGKGSIDVIVGPSSYKQEEKENVPFVTMPQ